MKRQPPVCNSYILDTYRLANAGTYRAGAITFAGRKKLETIQWNGKIFDTQEQANAFVRGHFRELGIAETNEGDLFRPMMRFANMY